LLTERYGSGIGVYFHRGHSFLRAFDIKRYIKRDVKMPCKWVSLSLHRGLTREPGGDSLAWTF
jgi:hypothetical protein